MGFLRKMFKKVLAPREDDKRLPTGQKKSEIFAMHQRAMKETDSERAERLGVNIKDPIASVTVSYVEEKRPQKDAFFEFTVFGDKCKVRYFSDWEYLKSGNLNPEDYHYDPRRWVDVEFRGQTYGYAWPESRWTYSADSLAGKEQIEYMVCKHFGTLYPEIDKDAIFTTKRQSIDGKYLLHGRFEDMLFSAEFKHKGYVVYIEAGNEKMKYNTRNDDFQAPVKACPARTAIKNWVNNEYLILSKLDGAPPPDDIKN